MALRDVRNARTRPVARVTERAAPPPELTPIRSVALLGNHLPRQCGIATFTGDLCDALRASDPGLECFVAAMNDTGGRYAYPGRVRVQIEADDVASYRRAAEYLNDEAEVVCVQHEYGIFGGRAGELVSTLLRALRVPVLTTLHTILPDPDPAQRLVMNEIVARSDRLVVMSEHGRRLLQEVHAVPEDRIEVIPHGIHPVPTSADPKRAVGLDHRRVLMTFGLLSPDKGIEHVIDALPAIVAVFPDTVYLLLGVTHPHIKERQGEAYRDSLVARARALGVAHCFRMEDRFLSGEELSRYMAATDIYLTPYLKPDQSTSGTLAYAIGAGKAVISTSYDYARDLLAGDRGILVPARDGSAIAHQVIRLFEEPSRLRALEGRAATYGATMRWPEVAQSYRRALARAKGDRTARVRRDVALPGVGLPPVRLEHLSRLTDGTGILQHAAFDVPRYGDGYCVDDNARALWLVTHEHVTRAEASSPDVLSARYLAFLAHALDGSSRRFRNFLSYDRRWIEEMGSEDAHGRALWALGAVTARPVAPPRRALATQLFDDALGPTLGFTSPRAWAYTLLGLDERLRAGTAPHAAVIRTELAARLLARFRAEATPEWPWLEERPTYCNARIPQALLASGTALGDTAMIDVGLGALSWLASIQRSPEGAFSPVGSLGFHGSGRHIARFDQQPVEACAMVSACLLAHRITGTPDWQLEARRAFDWYLGRNVLGQPVADVATGGCRDGLHEDRVNENQGAESTISYLSALVEMRAFGGLGRGERPE